jgi:hypothetical protein
MTSLLSENNLPMKKLQFIFKAFFSVFLIIQLQSCDFDRSGLKPSTGKTNEMLVVTNSESIWNGSIGVSVKEYFGQYQIGLPQPESMFDLAHIPENNFSQMFKTHHNIFIVDINPGFDQPLLETRKDLWARPQRVVKMTVSDRESFFEVFDENKEAFLELFYANERRRAAQAFGSIEDFKIKSQIADRYDIDVVIPKSFTIASQTDDFVWLRREAQQFSQGILIYFYPYTDTIAFEPTNIMDVRNGFTKQHVPGPAEGSFMRISMIEPPVSRRIDFNGNFAVEMRGLWELEGDFMGGPFINYTMVDELRRRVVTIDGFVYYPNQDKKNLLRQIESLIFTLTFPQSEDISEDI